MKKTSVMRMSASPRTGVIVGAIFGVSVGGMAVEVGSGDGVSVGEGERVAVGSGVWDDVASAVGDGLAVGVGVLDGVGARIGVSVAAGVTSGGRAAGVCVMGLGVLVVVEIGRATGPGGVLYMQPERTSPTAIESTATYSQLIFVMVSRTCRPYKKEDAFSDALFILHLEFRLNCLRYYFDSLAAQSVLLQNLAYDRPSLNSSSL